MILDRKDADLCVQKLKGCSPGLGYPDVTIWLKVHMLTKWKSCEKSWMVRAALTRHRRRRFIAEESTFITPGIICSGLSSSASNNT